MGKISGFFNYLEFQTYAQLSSTDVSNAIDLIDANPAFEFKMIGYPQEENIAVKGEEKYFVELAIVKRKVKVNNKSFQLVLIDYFILN